MEWFKSAKRAAVPPPIPAGAVAPAPPELEFAAALAPIKSPKAVFDSADDAQRSIRPLAAPATGFMISSTKNGETDELQLTSPTMTVAKARMLFKSGWRVQVINAAGRQFAPSEFDEILRFD